MIVYQIVDWNENFENSKSRRVKNKQWVPIPNKQHGTGYLRLLDRENGAALYGAWVAVVLRYSQVKSHEGYLSDSGDTSGAPWCHRDISRMTSMPEEVIAEMLEVVSHPAIGWIVKHEVEDTTPLPTNDLQVEGHDEVTAMPLQDPKVPLEGKGIEGNRIERNTHSSYISGCGDFEQQFSESYKFVLDQWERATAQKGEPFARDNNTLKGAGILSAMIDSGDFEREKLNLAMLIFIQKRNEDKKGMGRYGLTGMANNIASFMPLEKPVSDSVGKKVPYQGECVCGLSVAIYELSGVPVTVTCGKCRQPVKLEEA